MSDVTTPKPIRRTPATLFTLAIALALLIATAGAASAVSFNIINRDGPAEGLNDLTAVVPVGGNSGTTLGAQRLEALQYAAGLWGARLTSSVPIDVDAWFDPHPCDVSGATIGTWGPTFWHRDFAHAPVPVTWYPTALANKLADADLCPGGGSCGTGSEIELSFTSSIDGGGCAAPFHWYYGLDANPAADEADFVTHALMALASTVGMTTTLDLGTGDLWNGRNDILMTQLIDMGGGERLVDMDESWERLEAITRTGSLHWMGIGWPVPYMRTASVALSAGVGPWRTVSMYAPDPPEAGLSVAYFSPEVAPDQLLEAGSGWVGSANHDFGLADDALAELGWAQCGNNVTEMDEECDDGGLGIVGCDGCYHCKVETGLVCGDGVLNTHCSERCDDGNVAAGDGCDAACNMEESVQQCQKAIGKIGTTFYTKATRLMQGCRNRINDGTLMILPENCASEPSVVASMTKLGIQAHEKLMNKCDDTLVAALNACASTVNGLVDEAGNGGCITDAVVETVAAEVRVSYGRVLDPVETGLEYCQRAIAKEGTKFFRAHLKFRLKCRGHLNAGDYVPCDPDLDAKVQRAYEKLFDALSGRCGDPTIVDLGPCDGHPARLWGLVSRVGDLGCLEMTMPMLADDLVQELFGQ